MREICLPLPEFPKDETTEITVSAGEGEKYYFRIEAFPWKKASESSMNVNDLRDSVTNYDKAWELIQIYTPAEEARVIHVLFRKR